MGSHLLTWERGAGPLALRERCAAGARRLLEQGKRLLTALSVLVLPLLALLVSSQARHWVAETITTVCVLGGFVLAPVLTLLAWVGMALPAHMPLHQVSTPLFAVALIWTCAALVGAHVHHAITSRREQ